MSPINHGFDLRAVTGVTQDSRDVQAGYLFAALPGEAEDGRKYIADAISRGAKVILADEGDYPNAEGVQFVKCKNARKVFSHVVSDFYKKQPECVVAVTGTNGKSSVVHFVDQLWRAIGKKSDFIGTLSGTMTTPDPVTLHSKLARLSDGGVTHVAMEASSHGLAQYRMDGVKVSVAAFTSFSQDHLDYHQDMDAYLNAKTRLFSEVLPIGGTAVLNADSIAYASLRDVEKRRGIRVLSYGENGAELKLISADVVGSTQRMKIEVLGRSYTVNLPLVGRFQAMNALCALGCVVSEDERNVMDLVLALETLSAVTGRLQHIQTGDGLFHAYVDYAHTPDALRNVLEALRPHTTGRLICLFGCGGDRDRMKRPIMGGIAASCADIVIITDDNPRSEDPLSIRAQILAGVDGNPSHVHEVQGRRTAIKKAVSMMEAGDVLLVAGKGHEQGQIFNGVTEPFDDVSEVQNVMFRVKVKEA